MIQLLEFSVLIVDDHALVRSGMRRLLEDHKKVSSIEEASSGEEALELSARGAFDLVLMDINLPGMDGLEASEKLLELMPNSRIIMVTGRLECGPIRKLLNSGIRGYVTKGSSADEMDKAIRQVAAGEQYLSPDAAQRVAMDTIRGVDGDPFDKLTTREHEIIVLLLQGLRNRQISQNLFISEKTVSTHRTRSFEKLGVATTADLVRLAIRTGLWNE